MASMLDRLIGEGVKRPDNKRIVPSRRPLPGRPRELLEIFAALGQQATIPSLAEACDLRQADPRHITFIALSRWPTADEVAALPDPYVPRAHLRDLLIGEEFGASLVRRICDAYPERPRLFYVRIPRCAGDHFLHMAKTMHAVVPPELMQRRRGDQARFIPALGAYIGRFNSTRTIQVTLPSLAPFIQAETPRHVDSGLNWTLNPPPRRPGDRLFTIVREPTGLVLSQVNAILTGLQASPGSHPDSADWRARLGPLPPATDAEAWKDLGRRILSVHSVRNPICHALGTGTAASALQACRLSDIEIADLSLYRDWVTYTWDVEPEPATNASSPLLGKQDLDTQAATRLAELVAEDIVFYTPIAAALAQLGEMKTAIRGRDL